MASHTYVFISLALIVALGESGATKCVVPDTEGTTFFARRSIAQGGSFVPSGFRIFMSCKSGYLHSGYRISTCLESGKWSPLLGSCSKESPNICGHTPIVLSGDVASGSNSVGSIRQIICKTGYNIYGRSFVRCNEYGTWTKPGICIGPKIHDKNENTPNCTGFQCRNGKCIDAAYTCNTKDDCGDSSDEQSCRCNGHKCKSGECIPSKSVCDGKTDCNDGGDEAICPGRQPNLIKPEDMLATLLTVPDLTTANLDKFMIGKKVSMNTHQLFVQRFCGFDIPDATFLLVATACNQSVLIMEYLFNKGATDINRGDSTLAHAPLHYASSFNNAATVQFLIWVGADVNVKSKTGTTPLMVAAANGHENVVKSLLSSPNVNVNYGGMFQQSPLTLAAAYSYVNVMGLLLDHGAEKQGCHHHLCQ